MHPSADFVARALDQWPIAPPVDIRLVNFSENHTFAVTAADGARYCLRVHRPGYQSPQSIQSELAWLDALQVDAALPVPQPLAGRGGALLQCIDTRHCVLFRHIEGEEPGFGPGLEWIFEILGAYAARMHRHAANWARPPGFTRHVWSADQVLDPEGLWGDWRTAPGVDASIHAILDRVDERLRADLAAYGSGTDRFGLIHADMRLGNLIVDDERVSLIDFDDSGFCWFGYDFAAAVSFHEAEPEIASFKDAWLRGYLPLRALSPEDIAALDTLVLLRRMALLAWIGSHSDTTLARSHESGFAEGTAELAGRYLEGRNLWS